MKVIHVLRKPLSEPTVVANVLKYGTGALNIDATRIGTAADVPSVHHVRHVSEAHMKYGKGLRREGDVVAWEPKGGRWPANLVLQHLDGCVQTGVREDSFNTAVSGTFGVQTGERLSGLKGIGSAQRVNAPTTTPVYECKDGCPVAALDAQSGERKSPRPYAKTQAGFRTEYVGGAAKSPELQSTEYGDAGGASRFFKQFGGDSS